MRPWGIRLAAPMALLATACSTMSPEQHARQDILWEVATGCARGTATITVNQIDHLDRVHYTLSQGGQQDVPAFLDCYQKNVRAKLPSAGLLQTARPTPDKPASIARPAPRETNSAAQPAPTTRAPDTQPAHPIARPSTPPPDSPAALAAPQWAVGDEWEFRARTPRWTGTFVWSLAREDSIEGHVRWTMSRQTVGLAFPRSLSASGVVRAVTEGGVELDGAHDLTGQGFTAGNRVTYSPKRSDDRLDGVAQGAGDQQLRVSVKRTR